MKQTTITMAINARNHSTPGAAAINTSSISLHQHKNMKTIFLLITALFITVAGFSQVTSFAGKVNNGRVDLSWATASEKNISHFIVEKSADGKEYKQAGMVFAYGNTSETMNYPFFEKNINTNKKGNIYYRLISVTADGKVDFSQVITIKTGEKTETAQLNSSPVPAA